jgi:hypothetical protein
MKKLILAILCSLGVTAQQPAADVAEVPNFALLDHHGRYRELHQADGKSIILFFTGNGCPIARQSVPKLRAIEKRFAKEGVTVWAVNSYPGDTREEIGKEVREFRFGHIPVLLDQTQVLALSLDVQRTAEVVAISTKDWKPFYRGAIDDQLTEGAQKPEGQNKYLENALKQFLAGEPVSTPRTAAKGCLIAFEKVSDREDGAVSYSKQVAPIIASKCAGCHRPGDIAPFAFSNYSKVKNKARMIEEVIATKRMPPWHADPLYGHFENDRSLTAKEAQTIIRWARQGAAQDEGEDILTAHAEPAPEWPLGKPDYILKLPKPEMVPATGILEYRHIKIPNVVPQDCWLSAIYVKPGNRKVVHHVILRAKSEGNDDGSGRGVGIVGWAPGSNPAPFRDGVGRFLPKKSTFDVEMHYTTMGSEQTDQTEIGLYVLPSKPKLDVKVAAAINTDFSIPPSEGDSRTFATHGFQHDAILYSLSPHMHLRGSWFKYEALYPDGTREVLLSVPHYDFNWQTQYRFVEPKHIAKGTWILCTGGFDNSAKNPSNPDAKKRVGWGDQSFDEMFIGFMDVGETADAVNVSSK